jgi:antitoxin VapB
VLGLPQNCAEKVHEHEYQKQRDLSSGQAAFQTNRGSLTTAITEAVRERLDRVRRERGVDLAERLLLIGRDCAAHFKEPFRTIKHEDMLYDDRGLPK